MEKLRKLQTQLDSVNSELASEKANVQKLESDKLATDRQNKELRAKLAEVENNQRTKTKATITGLESKIVQLEDQLEAEVKERQNANKNFRKMEKRVKEAQMAVEEERRHTEQYKEQLEKSGNRIKALKRQLEELEEEVSREKALRRQAKREMEDALEANEVANRELANLKSKLRFGTFDTSQNSSNSVI